MDKAQSKRYRVLVVDDNLDTANTLTFLLRDSGHITEFALTGTAALDCAKRHRPEVIFLDIGLPDYDGIKLAGDIKKIPGFEKTHVIALTGRNSDDEERALQAGCDRFIAKPVDPRTLEKIISQSFEHVEPQ
jgi:CheY-like chemotaxis protein